MRQKAVKSYVDAEDPENVETQDSGHDAGPTEEPRNEG
jgi:hypothetical protein